MFGNIKFKNYRILKDVDINLSRCTLLLGPNGSGKSTLIRGLKRLAIQDGMDKRDRTLGVSNVAPVEITGTWVTDAAQLVISLRLDRNNSLGFHRDSNPGHADEDAIRSFIRDINRLRVFSLDPLRIAMPVQLQPNGEIGSDGSNLPVVLTQLQDQFPERFEALNRELALWLPEFDRILFATPEAGARAFSLRTNKGKYPVPAADLSHGTLIALCLLTLSYLPEPPSVVCLEDPDHGIHPRLLRQVHDAMIRLSHPESCGEQRPPVQVIATTHSPYFLDHFRDHPEDVVLAEKGDDGATFHRLTSMPHYEDIMHDAQLGDAWYSGILGGVPAAP